MSEDLGAVLDAPEVTDEVVDDQIADDGAEAPVDGVEPVAPVEDVKGDERTIPEWLRSLKATDPVKFKAEKALFFQNKAILDAAKDFDVKGTKSWLEEHGGREAIVASLGELQGKAAELDGIMTKIENGDPSLISDLSPETVAKLGPAMASQWAQADPEGWGAAMSSVFAQTIADNGVPMFLEKMGMLLEFGKTEDVAKMVQDLKGWANGFAQKAQAPRTAPTQQPLDKLAAREQGLNQREAQIFADDIQRGVDTFRDPTIARELESFIKRRPNDKDARDLAVSNIRMEVDKRVQSDSKLMESVRAFMKSKNKDGALRLIKSREEAIIKEVAPRIGRLIFGNPGPAKVEAAKPTPITRNAAPKAAADPRDAIMNRIFAR